MRNNHSVIAKPEASRLERCLEEAGCGNPLVGEIACSEVSLNGIATGDMRVELLK